MDQEETSWRSPADPLEMNGQINQFLLREGLVPGIFDIFCHTLSAFVMLLAVACDQRPGKRHRFHRC